MRLKNTATDKTIESFQSHPGGIKWRLLHRLQARYTGRADRTIVPSRYLSRIVTGWGVPEDKIHCIYNAVAPAEVPRKRIEDWDIVTVCRLVPWKGLDTLIDSAAQNNWRLRIVEDGNTGRLVPDGNQAALEAAIRQLMEDETLRQTLARNARRLIESEFSFTAMYAKTAKLLSDIAR
ncbi:MAG: hypothetical protein EBU57_05600 [Alphaproteobacteria bacterium]|nr:hypothetical protein [Alphaproteobacteria bacterium]